MNIRDYIKSGFEAYYDRHSEVGEDGFCVWMRPGVPAPMKADDSQEEWSVWKLVPSTVSAEDISALEKEFGLTFPEWYKAFISTYHHYFDDIPEQDTNEPLKNIRDMYNPLLCRLGYLPFAWDAEYGCIWCIDVGSGPDEDQQAIYEIDHEILFGMDEVHTDRKQLQEHLALLYPNFKAYFDHHFVEKG
ncbi:SMI1/KNR4 family protein [Paenibacillus sp. FSL W8-0194]|uniref:SMI1/KNR4 family protein n=1 Tax=Paenibacillus sp. FSL W8-0194 TaxID=2921711 RepID=UPI0030DD28DD